MLDKVQLESTKANLHEMFSFLLFFSKRFSVLNISFNIENFKTTEIFPYLPSHNFPFSTSGRNNYHNSLSRILKSRQKKEHKGHQYLT